MPKDIIIPDLLQAKTTLFTKQLADLQHPLLPTVKKLLLVSDFAARQIDLLRALLLKDSCNSVLNRQDYFTELKAIGTEHTQNNFMRHLRKYRNTHFLRLLLLENAGLASTESIMRSWSDCADALILMALEYCKIQLNARFGSPKTQQGQEVFLYTLAMGKLGGRELNYSSDIDLIFAFSQEGDTNGEESVSNSQYFSKVIPLFVQIMQQVTVDGFVFRVDLRLRPHGDSSPLVTSLSAMETYYQEQGRDWERYAMVKARVITELPDAQQPWFERLITPFVYRRYVDFSVIESLRSMKALIEREVQLNPRLDDIKRGKGGIREIEFIIQNFQLIRGGRLPQLQQRNAMMALAALKEEGLLPRCEALRKAYIFLRQLENVIQSLDDKQTHSLPSLPIQQAQICLAMDFVSWDALLHKLQQYQRIIRNSFSAALGKVEAYEDEKRIVANQLTSLWQGHIEESMAINLLTSLGYENAAQCYQMIHAFRHSRRCQRLTQTARMRLDRFMIMLFSELSHCEKTDAVLLQVMHLLENIVGRSPYLALLTENPQALKELLFWLANSPFITALLASQPFLLEVLLSQEQQWRPQSVNQLQKMLVEQLAHAEDFEAQEDVLRQFKLTQWLMAARAECNGSYSSVRTGQFLADVAEVIVTQVVKLSCAQLESRYPQIGRIKSGFAVIAYGKLGSREMNYTSDLDLVFLHNVKPSDEALVIRLTQKIVHMLTTRSRAGVLYDVDTRLRPSGSAGLLVSPIDAFVGYQKTQAWTWEHQALLRARVLTGTTLIKRTFQVLKQDILALVRDKDSLQKDVLAMRSKISNYQEPEAIKHEAGGLIDLEFLVQFLMLSLANPNLAAYTQTVKQIEQLVFYGALSKDQGSILIKAYQRYHHVLHASVLQPEASTNPEPLCAGVLMVCQAIYNGVY